MVFTYRKLVFKILPLVLLILFGGYSYGQESKSKQSASRSFKDRLFVGGALGFSFGNYSSLIDVSPIFGFAVTDRFVVGLGLTYKYYKYKEYYATFDNNGIINGFYDLKTNMYGGSIWMRYFLTGIGIPVIENIFLHAEVEPLLFNHNYRFDPGGNFYDPYGNRYSKDNEQITLTSYFLGGGLRQMLGQRSYLYIEVLWNFNEELYTPYSNPRIRIGVAAAL
jgi:hypothetical protein